MFDLNEAVAAWRRAQQAGDVCTAADLDELESHLREQAARLATAGLSVEEGFLIACRRLGAPERICAEFVKADPAARWRPRILWMIVGALGLNLGTMLISSCVNLGTTLALLLKASPQVIAGMPIALHLILFVAVIWGGVRIYRSGLTNPMAQRRLGAVVSGGRKRTLAFYLMILALSFTHSLFSAGTVMILTRQFSIRDYSQIRVYEMVYNSIFAMVLPVVLAAFALWMVRTQSAPAREC